MLFIHLVTSVHSARRFINYCSNDGYLLSDRYILVIERGFNKDLLFTASMISFGLNKRFLVVEIDQIFSLNEDSLETVNNLTAKICAHFGFVGSAIFSGGLIQLDVLKLASQRDFTDKNKLILFKCRGEVCGQIACVKKNSASEWAVSDLDFRQGCETVGCEGAYAWFNPSNDLIARKVEDKSVLVIGPADHPSPEPSEIVRYDIVVRLNNFRPTLDNLLQGDDRCDLLVHCLNENLHDQKSPGIEDLDLDESVPVISAYPFWEDEAGSTFERARGNRDWIYKHFAKISRATYVPEAGLFMKLVDLVGARPTTGLCAIWYILSMKPADLHISRMTFLKTGYQRGYWKDYNAVSRLESGNVDLEGTHNLSGEFDAFRKIYEESAVMSVDNVLLNLLQRSV